MGARDAEMPRTTNFLVRSDSALASIFTTHSLPCEFCCKYVSFTALGILSFQWALVHPVFTHSSVTINSAYTTLARAFSPNVSRKRREGPKTNSGLFVQINFKRAGPKTNSGTLNTFYRSTSERHRALIQNSVWTTPELPHACPCANSK